MSENHFRKTVTHEGLNGLTVLFIEKEVAANIDYNARITEFPAGMSGS
jgi:hypothetical protein